MANNRMNQTVRAIALTCGMKEKKLRLMIRNAAKLARTLNVLAAKARKIMMMGGAENGC